MAGERLAQLLADARVRQRTVGIEPGKSEGVLASGYRRRVKDSLELLTHGASWGEILAGCSFLEREDIQACLDFAAAQSDHAIIKVS
jgi:uncharacterized protein (DUF433 family)